MLLTRAEWKIVCLLLALVCAPNLTYSGVSVTQNISPGATSWPGAPILVTLTNPAVKGTVGESFNAVGGCTNYGQTFTISTTNYTLQTISLYAGPGSGTGTGTNLTLNLYDLGSQTAPNPSPYSAGSNLFGGGAGLSINLNSSSANAILQLDFDGPDQALLQLGHMYVFEIAGALNTQPILWVRTTNDTYSAGAAYRNGSWINGNSARDFALAVYGSVYGVAITNPTITASATVQWTNVHQQIDGFGASSAWRSTWSASAANTYFSTNTGIGLSLLRNHIAPGGTTVETTIMQMARDRGARVWSAPWTPVTSYKTPNQNGVISQNGGGFDGTTANYQTYAAQLAGYVVSMKNTYGVNLYALSMQNEPDFNTTNYESCVWTAQQIHDFVPYLSAALAASNVASTKIIIPESDIWSGDTSLYTTTMNDANVAPLVSVIANHNYVQNNNAGDQTTPAVIPKYGKSLWETEVSTFDAFDASITNAMYWARRIHLFLTVPEVNAWHYWWLSASDNSGIANNSDVLAKRGYVLGQFSRFVRPGYYRINVSANTGPLLITAFKNPVDGKFAIVAINTGTIDVSQTFNLSGFEVGTNIAPWLTSASASLSARPSIAPTGSTFSNTIPAMSVVTFVGQASNHAPALVSIPDQTFNAGVSFNVTNVATDPDAPPQTLTFSLLSAPTNTSLNSSNGVLTWRPLVSQANSTNLITVRVADNGSPSLSATSSFSATVNPLSSPTINSIDSSEGVVNLSVSGALGPDYTLLTSTNLIDWQALLTTNPPVMPLLLLDTNTSDAVRYYRFQLGP